MLSFDSISFDDAGYTRQPDPLDPSAGEPRVWHLPAGDHLGLFYFPLPPDLPIALTAPLATIRATMRAGIHSAGVGLISLDLCALDGCVAIRKIVKVPQRPHGMTYLGSLTLPFRDFSFVLKVQCAEHGITGMRDTIVLQELFLARLAGKGRPDVASGELTNWADDPYDPSIRKGFIRNRAEREEHDARFPTHPLSRCRTVLRHLEATVAVGSDVRAAAAWEGPPQVPARPWWRVW